MLASARTYVISNLEKVDYPRYRKLGLPVSSAPVESEIEQFSRRVKGTEKFRTEEGAEAVLQVRAAYLSGDGRADRSWALPRPRYGPVGRNRLALVYYGCPAPPLARLPPSWYVQNGWPVR